MLWNVLFEIILEGNVSESFIAWHFVGHLREGTGRGVGIGFLHVSVLINCGEPAISVIVLLFCSHACTHTQIYTNE